MGGKDCPRSRSNVERFRDTPKLLPIMGPAVAEGDVERTGGDDEFAIRLHELQLGDCFLQRHEGQL